MSARVERKNSSAEASRVSGLRTRAGFPDYPAPVIRNTEAGSEMTLMRWGMPPPPRAGGPPVTNIRNSSSPHWRGWLPKGEIQGRLGLHATVPLNSVQTRAPADCRLASIYQSDRMRQKNSHQTGAS